MIGSAVYMGRWLKPALDMVNRLRAELGERPVWRAALAVVRGLDDDFRDWG